MKEQSQFLDQARSYLSYFRQMADIHFTTYKAQSFSGLNDYEKHIIFSEMIAALNNSSSKKPEDKDTPKAERVLGMGEAPVTEQMLKIEAIQEQFGNIPNLQVSYKMAKKHWKKVSKYIEETHPEFDHFFKIAEERYKAIDLLAKINKPLFEHYGEPDFLLECQKKARSNIIEINRIKYDRSVQIIKYEKDKLKIKHQAKVAELQELELQLSTLGDETAESKNDLQSSAISLKEYYDNVHQKKGDINSALKSVTLQEKQIGTITKQIKDKQVGKTLLEVKIQLLRTETGSLGEAIGMLSEKQQVITKNYLKSYCNYRQSWIVDDGNNPNLPANCVELNFQRGSPIAPDSHEAGLILDGVDFSDIAITLKEIATADEVTISRIAIPKEKKDIILGVKKGTDLTQANNMLGQVTEISCNCEVPEKSYSLWQQGGAKWEQNKQKAERKDEETTGRRSTLSGFVRFRFRSATNTETKSSEADRFSISEASTRDTDEESSSDDLERPEDVAQESGFDNNMEESKTPAQSEHSSAKKESPTSTTTASPANTKTEPSLGILFEKMRRKAAEKPKIIKEQAFNPDDDTELEPAAPNPADTSLSSHSSSPSSSSSSFVITTEPHGVYVSLGLDIVGPGGPPPPQNLKNLYEENKTSPFPTKIKSLEATPSDKDKPQRFRFLRKMLPSKTTPPTQKGEAGVKSGTMTTPDDSAYPRMIARESVSEERAEFCVDNDGFGDIDAEIRSRSTSLANKPSSSVQKHPGESKAKHKHSALKPPEELFQEF